MISLIINGDDLGINHDRDRGILKAFTRGILTSASVVSNGASFDSAVQQVKDTGLPVGVHLNLADGVTLSGSIRGLTDQRGRLPGKQACRRVLSSMKCDFDAIRTELDAQISRMFEVGLPPDHLDSHQHCLLYPALTGIITDLARQHGIKAVRAAQPAEAAGDDPPGQLGDELALYRRLGRTAGQQLTQAELKTPDGLWGMPLLNRLDTGRLCLLLETIPDGCWELMTHPGEPRASGLRFDGQERQLETEALLSEKAREVIERRQIRLCSFKEMPCAS